MVHFLQQRTEHLIVKILGFLTVHIADVTEQLEMHFHVCERELYNSDYFFYLGFKT